MQFLSLPEIEYPITYKLILLINLIFIREIKYAKLRFEKTSVVKNIVFLNDTHNTILLIQCSFERSFINNLL